MDRRLRAEIRDWVRSWCTVYDLGRRLDRETPHSPVHPGVAVDVLRRHGEVVRADGGSSAFEALHIGCHTGTHVDAPSHIAVGGRLFGGHSVASSETSVGYDHGGIESVAPIVCEGILLDVASVLGPSGLSAGDAVTGEMLDRAAEAADIVVPTGCAVLIRLGRETGAFPDLDCLEGESLPVPGIDLSAAEWAIGHGVRVVGCDTIALEVVPAEGFAAGMPVHNRLLFETGTPILELLNLEELVQQKVFEFLFICSPLCVVNASGAPVRPLALV